MKKYSTKMMPASCLLDQGPAYMKPRKIHYLLLLLCCLVASGWGATIVYPRRSTTAIVKAGEHFDVWFDADSGQTVNAVELQGPYNTVYPAIRIAIGNWEYDADSHNTYDTKIAVSVPVHAPSTLTSHNCEVSLVSS